MITLGSDLDLPVFNIKSIEVGAFYNYFRDYNPATVRYVESNPIGLQGGINTYGYAFGSPLMYFDPDGLTALAVPLASPSLWPKVCKNPFSCAAGAGLAGGYTAGSILYPYVEPAIRAGIDYCLSGKEEDCEQEWTNAYKICRELISKGSRNWRQVGRLPPSLESCARGYVSEKCGGNKVEY